MRILALSCTVLVCTAAPQQGGTQGDQDENLESYYQEALQNAIADFTQSLYVHLSQISASDNFVFSPLSLHSALTLLYLGTKDNSTTQRQLGAAMGIVNNPELLKQSYKRVIETYRGQQSFLYGNHIWLGKGFNLEPEYESLVSRQFGSEVSNIDFERKEAVEEINDWISNMTNNKIQNLVDSFSSNTNMFLANALYFKEKWLEPFEDKDYNDNLIVEHFDTGNGKVKVPMIQQISSKMIFGEIKRGNNFLEMEVVTIPYENPNFEMQIIIPKKAKGLHFLEQEMRIKEQQDDKTSFNLFKALKNESFDYIEDVSLKMPKFKVKQKFDAAEALKGLGATDVFSSAAELNKITTGGPVAVGKVLHEAVVEVTKEGTEGAAATGVEIVLFSASFGVQKNIVVDKPFLFIVQDTANNIPVLVGRVNNPSFP